MQIDRCQNAAIRIGCCFRIAAPKNGSNRQKIGVDAIQALQQLFASTRLVRGNRRGSVVAV